MLDEYINKIINDDCLNVLKQLPDKCVDLVCTDCPYKIIGGGCATGTNENDIVVEPFAGGGATCIAAKNLKRRFIGIEIDEEYAKVAQERLEQEQRQLTMF